MEVTFYISMLFLGTSLLLLGRVNANCDTEGDTLDSDFKRSSCGMSTVSSDTTEILDSAYEQPRGGKRDVSEEDYRPRAGRENEERPRAGREYTTSAIRSGIVEFNRPRAGRQEYSRPRAGRSDIERPRAGREFINRPRAGRENLERPRAGREFESRPRAGREFGNRPRAGREYENRPRAGREYENRPRAGREFEERPRAGREYENRPRAGRENIERPRAGREFETRPRAGREFESRPRAGRGYESRPRAGREFESRPRAGREDKERPRAGRENEARPRAGREYERPRAGRESNWRPRAGRNVVLVLNDKAGKEDTKRGFYMRGHSSDGIGEVSIYNRAKGDTGNELLDEREVNNANDITSTKAESISNLNQPRSGKRETSSNDRVLSLLRAVKRENLLRSLISANAGDDRHESNNQPRSGKRSLNAGQLINGRPRAGREDTSSIEGIDFPLDENSKKLVFLMANKREKGRNDLTTELEKIAGNIARKKETSSSY